MSILIIYLKILSIFLIILGFTEIIKPFLILKIWLKWLNSKSFFLHGLIITAGAFPLTQFRDTITGKMMLVIGLIEVVLGPIIFFYPEYFRETFRLVLEEFEEFDLKKIVQTDAIIRIICAFLFLYVAHSYVPK